MRCSHSSCCCAFSNLRPAVFFFSSRRRHTSYWRDWSSDVCSSDLFASDWSHLWLPYKGILNQIKILREPHMKYNVTQLEEKNEPVDSMLGNYFIELEPGNYQAEEASNSLDAQPNLLRFLQADEINCNIVNLAVGVDSCAV